jgi:hypothetical protein
MIMNDVHEKFWLKRTKMIELLGLSASRFDVAIRPLIPQEATKGTGGKLLLDARVAVQLLVAHRVEIAVEGSADEDSVKSEDDEWLRRFRQARALKLETETALLQRQLIPAREVMVMVSEFAIAARQFAETVRNITKDAGLTDLYHSLIDRCSKNIAERLFKESEEKALADFTSADQASYLADTVGREREMKQFVDGLLKKNDLALAASPAI